MPIPDNRPYRRQEGFALVSQVIEDVKADVQAAVPAPPGCLTQSVDDAALGRVAQEGGKRLGPGYRCCHHRRPLGGMSALTIRHSPRIQDHLPLGGGALTQSRRGGFRASHQLSVSSAAVLRYLAWSRS